MVDINSSGLSSKPKIIVIEGIDGSGKQTQSKLLTKYLESKNKSVTMQSFPNYESQSTGPVKLYLGGELSKTAEEITAYQSSVLFAVDRFCTMKILLQKIPKDSIIVFDRYVSSNMLHQGGKIESREKLVEFLNWLDSFEYNTMDLPKPDMVFFLDMPPVKSMELAHQRSELKAGTKEDIHEKDKNHLLHAYNAGKFIAEKYKWNIINCLNSKGELRSAEEINGEIIEKVNQFLGII